METKVGVYAGVLTGFFSKVFSAEFWLAMFYAFCAAIVGYLGTLFIKWLIKIMKRK